MKGSPHSVVGADARFLRPGAGLVVTLLALAPAVTLVTVLAFRSISTSKDAIIDENAQGLVDTEELCTLFERKVAESRAFMLTGEEHYLDAMLRARSEFADIVSRLQRTANPFEMQLLNALQNIEQEDQSERVRFINQRRGGADPEMLRQFETVVRPKRSELDRALHSFEGFKERQLTEARGLSRNQVFRTALAVSSLALLAFALAAALAARLATALARLKQSEERLQMLIVGVKDYAIFSLDADGRVATWNWGAERIYGYRAEDIIGQPFQRFYLKEDRENLNPDVALRIAAAEGRYEADGWRARDDGSVFWSTTVLTALRDSAGRLRGFSTMSRDVTEHKRVHDELLEVNRTLDALIQTSPVAVVAVDTSGVVNKWNPAAERLFGWKTSEVLAKPVTEVMVTPDEPEEPCDILQAIAAGFACEDHETTRRRKDGSIVEVSIYTATLTDASGTPRGAMALLCDISERRRAEREREDAFRERDRLLQKADQAARAREEFLSMASHDLRSPLSTLQLQSRGLLLHARREQTVFAGRMVNGLERIDRNVVRINNFVNSLLDVSRFEASQLDLCPSDVDLAVIVPEILERSKEQLEQAGCLPTLTSCGSLIGRWDPIRLEQIITNLLDNAMKYGRGKPIELTIGSDGDNAILSIQDHGPGIKPEDQERIFDKATRGTGSTHVRSFGFGLWIVRTIVAASGGSVRVTSQPNRGATFTVVLPRRASMQHAESQRRREGYGDVANGNASAVEAEETASARLDPRDCADRVQESNAMGAHGRERGSA